MKKTMKRLTAYLLALLLVLQIVPVSGDEVVISSNITGPITNYRDKLKISSTLSLVPVGSSVKLTATGDYDLEWTSSDETIATVDENGNVTGVSAGQVRITAQEGSYSDSLTLRVIGAEPDGQTAADETMIVVVNVSKEKTTYDGAPHSVGFTAVSNTEGFDETKVKMIRPEKEISGKDCGVYQTKFEPEDFTYEGSAEKIEFVVSNGWLQIKPATVNVTLGEYTKKWGDPDPDFTEGMTVEGLMGDDTVEALGLQVIREEGEEPDFYTVMLADKKNDSSNYRISAKTGILVIERRKVKVRSSMEGVTEAVAGTEVTLTAEMEGLDTERFKFQWQMGDSKDDSSMKDIEGANDPVYTYILDESTAGKYFRVLVSLR